jgi:hypothetical protein
MKLDAIRKILEGENPPQPAKAKKAMLVHFSSGIAPENYITEAVDKFILNWGTLVEKARTEMTVITNPPTSPQRICT